MKLHTCAKPDIYPDMTQFRTVKPSFDKYGCRFTQLRRRQSVALYEYRNPEGALRGFELVVLRNQEATVIKGRNGQADTPIEAQEVYPSSSQWGVFGWTLLPVQEAEAHIRFAELAQAKHPEEVTAFRKRSRTQTND